MVVAERVKQMEGGRGGEGEKGGKKDSCIQSSFNIVNCLFIPFDHLSMWSGMLELHLVDLAGNV